MSYLIGPFERLDELSRRLWQIVRPNPAPGDVTTHLLTLIKHPTRDEWAMDLRFAKWRPRMHAGRNGARLRAMMQAMNVPTAQLNAIRDRVQAGGEFDVGELIPPAIRNAARTPAQMRTDGWFAPSVNQSFAVAR